MEAQKPGSGSRLRIWRNVILYTPVAAFLGLLLAYLIYDRALGSESSSIIFVIILGIFFLLFVWQSAQAIMDLWAAPVVTTGIVKRKWSRPVFLFFGHSYYVHVDRCVFSIDQLEWSGLQLGDIISVRHYPHTWTVIDIERVVTEP